MVRKSFQLDEHLAGRLAVRARALGISQNAFVRRALERELGTQPPRPAWARVEATFAELGTLGRVTGHRNWTREDAYRP